MVFRDPGQEAHAICKYKIKKSVSGVPEVSFLYFVIFLILKVINERSGFDLAMKAKKAKYSVSRCRILHVWLPKNAVS